MKGFVVNHVNPKFKEYNKPFFLAVVVAIPTAVLTLALFHTMVNTCSREVKVESTVARMSYRIGKDGKWPCRRLRPM